MVSIQAKALNRILKLANLKKMMGNSVKDGGRGVGKGSKPPNSIYRSLDVEKSQVLGRSVYTLKTKDGLNGKHVLYLHGGAYVYGFSKFHWKFVSQLVQASGHTFVAPDYPLAPKHTYIDSYRMVIPVYKDLVDRVGADNVILMGDSAGGGFALSLAQAMKAEGVDSAAQIIMVSPWLDLELKNEGIKDLESRDPILAVSSLRKAAMSYAGGDSLSNHLLSPINGDLDGLGEISIFIGTNDILLADVRRLKKMAEERGVTIRYFEYADMLHDWVLFSLPESKEAVDQIAALIE